MPKKKPVTTKKGQHHKSKSFKMNLVKDNHISNVNTNVVRNNKESFEKKNVTFKKRNADLAYFHDVIYDAFPSINGKEFSLWRLTGNTTTLIPFPKNINNAVALCNYEDLNRSAIYIRLTAAPVPELDTNRGATSDDDEETEEVMYASVSREQTMPEHIGRKRKHIFKSEDRNKKRKFHSTVMKYEGIPSSFGAVLEEDDHEVANPITPHSHEASAAVADGVNISSVRIDTGSEKDLNQQDTIIAQMNSVPVLNPVMNSQPSVLDKFADVDTNVSNVASLPIECIDNTCQDPYLNTRMGHPSYYFITGSVDQLDLQNQFTSTDSNQIVFHWPQLIGRNENDSPNDLDTLQLNDLLDINFDIGIEAHDLNDSGQFPTATAQSSNQLTNLENADLSTPGGYSNTDPDEAQDVSSNFCEPNTNQQTTSDDDDGETEEQMEASMSREQTMPEDLNDSGQFPTAIAQSVNQSTNLENANDLSTPGGYSNTDPDEAQDVSSNFCEPNTNQQTTSDDDGETEEQMEASMSREQTMPEPRLAGHIGLVQTNATGEGVIAVSSTPTQIIQPTMTSQGLFPAQSSTSAATQLHLQTSLHSVALSTPSTVSRIVPHCSNTQPNKHGSEMEHDSDEEEIVEKTRPLRTSARTALMTEFETLAAILRNNFDYFLEFMVPKVLIDRLHAEECLTDEETMYIKTRTSDQDKSFEIMKTIRRIPSKYNVFVTILREKEQHRVAEVADRGGAVMKVSITFEKQTNSADIQQKLYNRIQSFLSKTGPFSVEVVQVVSLLARAAVEIIEAKNSRYLSLWLWCRSEFALQKFNEMNESSNEELSKFFSDFFALLDINDQIPPIMNIDLDYPDRDVVLRQSGYAPLAKLAVGQRSVCAVTSHENNVYALTRNPTTILVYTVDNPSSTILETTVRDIKDPVNMVFINEFVFVSDSGNSCIWQIKVALVPYQAKSCPVRAPYTMSALQGRNILKACCGQPSTLNIYDPDFKQAYEISLPSSIQFPCHAVGTLANTFIVSYKEVGPSGGLCEVNSSGDLLSIFDMRLQAVQGVVASVNQSLSRLIRSDALKGYPEHFTLNERDEIFATDRSKDGILVYNSRLMLEDILEKDSIKGPSCIHYVVNSNLLLVVVDGERYKPEVVILKQKRAL